MDQSVAGRQTQIAALERSLDEAMSHLLGYSLVRANLHLRDCFEQSIRAPLGLSPVEFTLLTALANSDGLTQKVLARLLHVQPPNLTVIVARLIRRGLLRKVRNQDDGRSHLLRLTDEGKSLQARSYSVSQTMEAGPTAVLNEQELATLQHLLGRIINNEAEQS